MAALMRSTDEEIDKDCKLARDAIEKPEKAKRETILKFEELFEKVERKVSQIEQIQTEHDNECIHAENMGVVTNIAESVFSFVVDKPSYNVR